MLTAFLVTAAATLLESAPFVLGGALLARAARRCAWTIPYLGCGCGTGASARSLPAAAATWLLFGPLVALARLAAAIGVSRLLRAHPCAHDDSLLAQLRTLLPIAGAGAASALLGPLLFGMHPPAPIAFLAAAATAFFAAPCALGVPGLAAALRTVLPSAAAGFLCVAGIFDLRAWTRRGDHRVAQHDVLAYALAALACTLVAVRGGAGLVHPMIAFALWFCAAACALLAYAHRREHAVSLRIAPAIMLVGAVLSAPPPQYHATETTLADAFAGERVDFTGAITHTGGATTLVRYAITCCRADASPIVLRLAHAPRGAHGWAHAYGVLVEDGAELELHTQLLQSIPAPSDPFVYR